MSTCPEFRAHWQAHYSEKGDDHDKHVLPLDSKGSASASSHLSFSDSCVKGQAFLKTIFPLKTSTPLQKFLLESLKLSSGLPGGSVAKESVCNAGDAGLIPGLGRSPGEGHGNPLQCSCLENPMGRGAWRATVHGVEKESDTTEWLTLSLFTFLWKTYTPMLWPLMGKIDLRAERLFLGYNPEFSLNKIFHFFSRLIFLIFLKFIFNWRIMLYNTVMASAIQQH